MSDLPDNRPQTMKPPIDVETLVRSAAFQHLFTHGEAVAPQTLAQVTGIRSDRMAAVLEQLDQAGRIRRNTAGLIVGSAGLSIVPDRHEIEVEGRHFWTWCAYDILGILGALRADGRALSPSPTDRKPIEVRFIGGRPQQSDAVLYRPDAELMDCCQNVYEEWCPNSNLFTSRDLAEAWAAEHGLSGRILNLDEAADLATNDWKSFTQGPIEKRRQSNAD